MVDLFRIYSSWAFGGQTASPSSLVQSAGSADANMPVM
jgi:hypothetical protein